MSKIKRIHAREILDSRGNPTVGAEVILSDGSIGVSCVPSGASTGKYEAMEKRDGNNDRYLGKGVLNAVNSIHNEILPILRKKDASDLFGNDFLMLEADGSDSKDNFGANAILAVSMACAKAASISMKINLQEYLANKASELNNKKIEHIANFFISQFKDTFFISKLYIIIRNFRYKIVVNLLTKMLTNEFFDG